MNLYLSRFQIAQSPDIAALGALLNPSGQSERRDVYHRLIWSAFADDPDAKRDFLWRDMGKGRFLVLSHRPPGSSAVFDPPNVQPWSPNLRSGDRLNYTLRVNATQTVKTGKRTANGKEHKQHRDIVMQALYPVAKEHRNDERLRLAQDVGAGWLAGQGTRAGFIPDSIKVTDYSVSVLKNYIGRRKGQPQFGILDMQGVLSVTDPEAFLNRVAQGFGRAKAFGCGLMLLRRVSNSG